MQAHFVCGIIWCTDWHCFSEFCLHCLNAASEKELMFFLIRIRKIACSGKRTGSVWQTLLTIPGGKAREKSRSWTCALRTAILVYQIWPWYCAASNSHLIRTLSISCSIYSNMQRQLQYLLCPCLLATMSGVQQFMTSYKRYSIHGTG